MIERGGVKNFLQSYRYFFIFIIIGFSSLIIEFFFFNLLKNIGLNKDGSSFLGLISGIIFAFYLNFFFNFEIHKSKITKAFIFFIVICFFSWSFQRFLGIYFVLEEISYEFKRLITSGIFFIVAYYLHKNFSFREFKKVGVAFYLTKSLNIKKIYKLIGNNTNFIHVDLIDKTFSKNRLVNRLELIKKIKDTWPNQEIHAHVMSKKPTKLVENILDYADLIFVHFEITENLDNIRKLIISKNKKFGVAITLKTEPKKILNILKKSSSLLILSVDNPGFSGQNFNSKAFKYIDFFNDLKFRGKFRICIDGGVNKNIVKILDVDDVVSNSSILDSNDPVNEIANLKSVDY